MFRNRKVCLAKGDDSMKRVLLGIGLTAVALTLTIMFFGSALAFSLSLQNLHINAASFAQPINSTVLASPMTSADEAQIGKSQPDSIRFEEYQATDHVCQRDKASDQNVGF